MKILTLNTHSYSNADFETNLQTLVEVIAERQYDIIALQEVNQPMKNAVINQPENYCAVQGEVDPVAIKEGNYADLICTALAKKGFKYYWSYLPSHIGYDKYDEGVAILAKTPFQAEGFLASSASDYADYHTRRILIGHFTNFDVYSCHYSWWKDDTNTLAFSFEWDKTTQTFSDKLTILMGDFNNAADQPSEGYQQIIATPNLIDSYISAQTVNGNATVLGKIDGWETNAEDKRIDYVFVKGQAKIEKHEVIFDGLTTPMISDHFGIEVTFNCEYYN
ncbi:MAG: endonuclease/exonuclease/phosphatase family protein [Lactobacillaceae bacterium]|jgi:maltose 6'-phosphate phosphatase|nr:endonuclease/exonuclease/phosphatase family protein [Lactobacillaceae bacterium]